MQCEICELPGTEHITELKTGAIVDRHFCPKHALTHSGKVSEQDWSEFYDWIVPYFQQHKKLPPTDEFPQHGMLGTAYASNVRLGPPEFLEYLQIQIQKLLSPSHRA